MKYLFDVSALVALGFVQHEFHERVAVWIRRQSSMELITCSITELGFVRVLNQAPQYGIAIAQARSLLLRIKTASDPKFSFISDHHDISHILAWVNTAKQITDGHLAAIAKSSGATLATLDGGIPGAFLIPPLR